MLLASRSIGGSASLESSLLRGSLGASTIKPWKRAVRSLAHGSEESHGGSSELKTVQVPAIRGSGSQSVGVVKLDMNATAINLRKSAGRIQGSESEAEGISPWWFSAESHSSSSTDSQDELDSSSDEEFEESEGPFALGSIDRDGLAFSAAPTINKASFEVLRLKDDGRFRFTNVRRRDLLRKHRLQHRDFRRIDPSIDFNKTSPSITIKENVLLICIGGVRALVTAKMALLFEPNSIATRKFFDLVSPNLRARKKGGSSSSVPLDASNPVDSHKQYMSVLQEDLKGTPPFELAVLEGALLVATGQLDAERRVVANQVQSLMTKLPRNVNPVNLEELRRVKSVLVELETKADTVRRLLEELMDDDDEMRDLNLSSRPLREERRRQREREKLKRELERAREAKDNREEGQESHSSISDQHMGDTQARKLSSPSETSSLRYSDPLLGSLPWPSSSPSVGFGGRSIEEFEAETERQLKQYSSGHGRVEGYVERASYIDIDLGSHLGGDVAGLSRPQRSGSESGSEKFERGREEGIQDAQDALEEMAEQEQEQEDIEEVEEVLQYYHQRVGSTESEAGRLLQGARDLEESIRVSLSAARYEVDRLELMLSIGSFAAAIGAMFAGIFGMNMRSNLEPSVVGFWATTLAIVLGCCLIFWRIMVYVKRRSIL